MSLGMYSFRVLKEYVGYNINTRPLKTIVICYMRISKHHQTTDIIEQRLKMTTKTEEN